MEMINATGRRKTAVARVYVRKGSGAILVNGADYKKILSCSPRSRKSC